MSHQQQLFEVGEDGRVRPCAPFDRHGDPIEPDGKAVLTLDQASALSGESPAALRERFRAVFGKIYLEEEIVADRTGAAQTPAPAAPAPAVATRLGDDLFRAMFYPHLSDEHYTYFLSECERRGFNPRSREIFADLRHNDMTGLPELTIFLGIAGMRRVLADTGRHAGNDEPTFVYEGDSPYPAKCLFTLYMMVEGVRCPYVGRALWAEYNPAGEPADAFRAEKPTVWLSKMAEADACRRACPSRLAGLYDRDEFRRRDEGGGDGRRRSRGPRPLVPQSIVNPQSAIPDDPDAFAEPRVEYDDDAPANEEAFNSVLRSYGFGSYPARQAVKAKLATRVPCTDGPREWWAAACRELRARPLIYGARVPEAVG